MLSLPFMYAPPPRRAESDSMNIQLSTIPLSPSHMMEPPLPPKYSSVAQSVGEGSVEYVSRSCVQIHVREDTWRVYCTGSELKLLHNNYAVNEEGERSFTEGFHLQDTHGKNTFHYYVYLHQKVPKILELFRVKKYSHAIFSTTRK